MTNRAKFLVLVGTLAGCGDYTRSLEPPADRFHYPTGMALRHLPSGCVGGTAGCRTVLYVTSSNFDLEYDPKTGGSLMAVDPDASSTGLLGRVGGPVRMGSFTGDVALVDEASCPGWESGGRQPLALVASRSQERLYALPLAAGGEPTCPDASCWAKVVPAEGAALGITDPYGLAISCRTVAGGALDASAWLTFLRGPSAAAWLGRIALSPVALGEYHQIGTAPTRSATFDPVRGRVYFTAAFAGPLYVPLRFVSVDLPSVNPPAIQLQTSVYGAETTGLAISSDGTRAYVALRLYDGDLARRVGYRTADTGGALAVVDLTETPAGGPSGTLLRLVPIGLGPSEVRAVPRAGRRDLVAVTCGKDSTLHLYDDQLGAVAKVIGMDPATGVPLLGREPFGLAVESPYRASAAVPDAIRLFVGSFAQDFVSVVQIDDPSRPGGATVVKRFGPERP